MASLLAEKAQLLQPLRQRFRFFRTTFQPSGFADHIPVVKAANIGVAELDTDTEKALQKFNARRRQHSTGSTHKHVHLGMRGRCSNFNRFCLNDRIYRNRTRERCGAVMLGDISASKHRIEAQNFLSTVKAEQSGSRLVLPYGLKRLSNFNLG